MKHKRLREILKKCFNDIILLSNMPINISRAQYDKAISAITREYISIAEVEAMIPKERELNDKSLGKVCGGCCSGECLFCRIGFNICIIKLKKKLKERKK